MEDGLGIVYHYGEIMDGIILSLTILLVIFCTFIFLCIITS